MNVVIRRSEQMAIFLLFAFGVVIGLATAPTIAYYASTNPQAVWQAGGATALFIAGFGTAGYATRRDLSGLARVAFWSLLGLILFGFIAIFVNIPNSAVIYCVLGLIIFSAFVLVDFQRLRQDEGHPGGAPARGLDLPRRPERLPALPAALRRPALAGSTAATRSVLTSCLRVAPTSGHGRNTAPWSAHC